MRIVIQRVSSASVSVDGSIVSQIESGMLVLVGVAVGDTADDAERLAAKCARLRIFDDENGVMNLSVTDVAARIIAVSQFTLQASTRKGNRPSYVNAERPERALPLYNRFCESLETLTAQPVGKGVFGAHMEVSLVNDGPVTIIIDSKDAPH